MNPPLIITCALVGAELTRDDTPYLPLTPDEIADSALGAHQAGAAMVHIHVRDAAGRPTCSEQVFQKVIGKIRQQSDLIIQVSTGGAVGDSYPDRFRPLEAGPDMASLTMGSINFGDEVFLNPRPFVQALARAMAERHIKPEIEVFDNAMLETALKMVETGELSGPLHMDLVMGVPGGMAATQANLDFLIGKIPSEATWSVAAIGRHQLPMISHAIAQGGHARVGMEDNVYLSKGVLAKSNAELVGKVVELAEQAGRPIATVAQARQLLHLKDVNRVS